MLIRADKWTLSLQQHSSLWDLEGWERNWKNKNDWKKPNNSRQEANAGKAKQWTDRLSLYSQGSTGDFTAGGLHCCTKSLSAPSPLLHAPRKVASLCVSPCPCTASVFTAWQQRRWCMAFICVAFPQNRATHVTAAKWQGASWRCKRMITGCICSKK